MYDTRLDPFREFLAEFYSGISPSPISDNSQDLIFAEYPELGLVVAGFSSWHGNDCFCRVGEIAPSILKSSQNLIAGSTLPVAVAVWHHSIVGGPRQQDYMDQRTVHKLIDFGFSVGLHGHQHYADAAPFELRLPNLTSMVVVGAGSLAVGDSELPMGERRQFNIVVIDQASKSITVHVRGMSPAGVFTRSHRDDFGGNSFIELNLPTVPGRTKKRTEVQQLDSAINALATEQYETALEIVRDIPPSRSPEKRQILIQALTDLDRQHELIDLLDPPCNINEVVMVFSIHVDAGQYDKAEIWLEEHKSLIPYLQFKELSKMIEAKRIIS